MEFDYKGSAMRVQRAGKTILHEIDFSYGEATEFQELASKDVANAVNAGKSTYSLSGNGYADNSAGSAQEDIASMFAWRASKDSSAITITDGITGNIQITGTAYLENIDITGTLNEVMTYSWTMKVTYAAVTVVS
jgi:hypothetical protein